jgi:hypothetical protein
MTLSFVVSGTHMPKWALLEDCRFHDPYLKLLTYMAPTDPHESFSTERPKGRRRLKYGMEEADALDNFVLF